MKLTLRQRIPRADRGDTAHSGASGSAAVFVRHIRAGADGAAGCSGGPAQCVTTLRRENSPAGAGGVHGHGEADAVAVEIASRTTIGFAAARGSSRDECISTPPSWSAVPGVRAAVGWALDRGRIAV